MARKTGKYRITYKSMPHLYRIVAIVVAAALVMGMYFYTDYIEKELSKHNRRVLNAYARLWSLAATRSVGAEELNIIFEEIIQKSTFPMILTNTEGVPMLWRNVSVEQGDTTSKSRQELATLIREMDASQTPIPILVGTSNKVLGFIHFGEASYIKRLRYVPILELVLLAGIIALYYVGYNKLRHYEEQNIWLGMAKETAHQLGTPISSLMGWLEILRGDLGKCDSAEIAFESGRNPFDIIEKMDEDIEILNKIVVRFGQVGSVPELKPTDLRELLKGLVGYLRERMPRIGHQTEIYEKYDPVPRIMANRLLLTWAVENLIKNSLEALPKTGGKITVAARKDVEGNRVQIIVTDNGRGISVRNARKIFKPGYTTKKRGWGLGLSLAKRIVEEYHFGKLFLLESVPFEKTTFMISFPLEKEE
ncbi:MAG: sensor histidine kinase [bacterium]